MAQTSVPATSYAASEFRVGRVLSKSFDVFSRNFVKFFIVMGVAALPGIYFYRGGMVDASRSGADMMHLGGAVVLFWLLTVLLNTLGQAVVLYGTFQDMRGRPVNLGDALARGLARFLPLLGLAICSGLGIAVGFLLLIVPGFIFLVMWYVATPACVVERAGPIRSMGRSAELTKGNRWKIFGMIFLLLIVTAIVSGVIGALLASVIGTIVELIWSALYGTYSAILVAVTYHDLRVVREGIDIEKITAVFD